MQVDLWSEIDSSPCASCSSLLTSALQHRWCHSNDPEKETQVPATPSWTSSSTSYHHPFNLIMVHQGRRKRKNQNVTADLKRLFASRLVQMVRCPVLLDCCRSGAPFNHPIRSEWTFKYDLGCALELLRFYLTRNSLSLFFASRRVVPLHHAHSSSFLNCSRCPPLLQAIRVCLRSQPMHLASSWCLSVMVALARLRSSSDTRPVSLSANTSPPKVLK